MFRVSRSRRAGRIRCSVSFRPVGRFERNTLNFLHSCFPYSTLNLWSIEVFEAKHSFLSNRTIFLEH